MEADVVRDRTLTSYPSIRTDLRNAGATVADQQVCIDGNLITSRAPDDLPAFCGAVTEVLRRVARPRLERGPSYDHPCHGRHGRS